MRIITTALLTTLAAVSVHGCAIDGEPDGHELGAGSFEQEAGGIERHDFIDSTGAKLALYRMTGAAAIDRTGKESELSATHAHSFTESCRALNEWIEDATGAAIRAWATGGCRRSDGTYTSSSSWSGRCAGELSNCDGQIMCGSTCPTTDRHRLRAEGVRRSHR